MAEPEVIVAVEREELYNTASSGGGIYAGLPGSVTLAGSSSVTGNTPDNCAPPGTITGCTG